MKKRQTTNNFVAKHAATFNKAQVHRDKKKDYSRKEKHKGCNSNLFLRLLFLQKGYILF
jgi:hypothetical protein